MHVIRVCPSYYPHFRLGGSVVADYEIDKALVLEGHAVTVLTCKEHKNDVPVEFLSERHKVVRFGAIGKKNYGISLGPLVELMRECLAANSEDKIVWFGGVWNFLTLIAPLICRFLNQRYIITPHGMLVPSLIQLKSSWIKRLCIAMVLKVHLEHAYKVHFTVAEERNDTILATGAAMNSAVFPLCFDLSRFDLFEHYPGRTPNKKVNLSFIGRITPKKRIDLVVEAVARLPQDVKKHVSLNVIGTDDEGLWDPVGYSTDRVGVEVRYLGPQYGSKLVDRFRDADIFILCSESENFAISVVEAAYCYCVPLITRSVGVGAYFTDESAIFSELNSTDMCKRIEAIVRDPGRQEKLARNARLVAEQFSTKDLSPEYFSNLIGMR